jgi:membrane protease YdiL (CAAX protease family)
VPRNNKKISTQVIFISIAYGVLFAIAILWSYLRGDRPLFETPDPMEPGWSALIGTTTGLLVTALSQLSASRFTWARRLEQEFARILGPLSVFEVVLLALTSSVAEEAFFRGAMQPALGFILTSLIFGLLHAGPSKTYLPWTAMALAMGFALGALYLLTGTLIAPVLCHFLINAINLRRISLRAQHHTI